MDTGLKGKTVLVTAGGSGIGRGIALALAKEGVHVAIASRNPDPNTVKEIKSLGVDALRICVDLRSEEATMSMVKESIDWHGKLDLYVNNAAWTYHEPAVKLTTKNWLNTLHTNLSACVWACREVGKHMIANESGSILTVGSTAMYHPLYRETSYRISKMGISMYTEVLACELAPFGIRVNCLVAGGCKTKLVGSLDPKHMETEMSWTPLRRLGKPEEFGNVAVFLLSDRLSSYMTGALVPVDGGNRLRPSPASSIDEIIEMSS